MGRRRQSIGGEEVAALLLVDQGLKAFERVGQCCVRSGLKLSRNEAVHEALSFQFSVPC